MQIQPIQERPLKAVFHIILEAVEIMKTHYGAVLTHDSGRDRENNKKATTWIFTFPKHQNAQISVPMNKGKIRFLMRGKTVDGKSLEAVMNGLAVVEKSYTDPDKGAPSSVLGKHARFLNPSPSNPLLSVIPAPEGIRELLDLYLGATSLETNNTYGDTANSGNDHRDQHKQRQLTAEELQKQLDRNSETGVAGELLVVLDELERLRTLGCSNPEQYVKRVAESDVSCGYDVASTWPDHERYIEVKSTISEGSDFFITENECKVLTLLGRSGWIYRVLINADGSGKIIKRLQDPFGQISSKHLTPVVWRVAAEVFDKQKVL